MLIQSEKTLRQIVAPTGTNNFVHIEPTAPARPKNNTLIESKKIAEAKQRLYAMDLSGKKHLSIKFCDG